MSRPRPLRPTTNRQSRDQRLDMLGRVTAKIRKVGTDDVIHGRVKCLNLRGLFTWCELHLPDDTECEIHLDFPDEQIAIDGLGWVVYSEDTGMAIQFDEFSAENARKLASILALHVARLAA
ncbi:MAG: hypothetical protein OEY97_03410 [Nitrospirota bacterium]|nr:hypothetical protein [Nitrospirota bacterium]